MLPSQAAITVHDPEYTLFDLQIHVPRGELIKESLHQLSRAMRARRKKAMTPTPTPTPTPAVGVDVRTWAQIFHASQPDVNFLAEGSVQFPLDLVNSTNPTASSSVSILPNTVSFVASSNSGSATFG
jgi:hypothetical protein